MDFNGCLDNGVELYTCTDPKLAGFCLSLWIRRGSMHEPAGAHGLVHFLEHAVFRNISERLNGRLYAELTRHGLCFDACTYTNYVRFEISGLASDFDRGLEILMMALEPPELSIDAMNMERRRIQTEIREEEARSSTDSFANGMVWHGTQLARSIAGTMSSTNRVGFDALRVEHERWFSRGNFFFCATGAVPDTEGLIDRLRQIETKAICPVVTAAPVPVDFFRRGALTSVRDGFSWLRLSFDVDTARHGEPLLMGLTEYLLGDVGQLYLALSEYTGLIYDLGDSFERFSNIGTICFELEPEQKQLYDALEAAVDVLVKAKHADDDVLSDAIQGLVCNDRIKQDHICTFNSIWGYDNGMCGCGFQSAQQRSDAYRAVTPEALRALAAEIFRSDNAVLCVRANEKRVRQDRLRDILMTLDQGSDGGSSGTTSKTRSTPPDTEKRMS